ncbi:hypothetical protein Aeh1ORF077c [Aeromonas phage Aeh1]|uniref:Uncharacterized protein n=1 Tax=Aeromonas phage Aeh1 TaxID=2880362 RepID=Q76Z09_9CAUD|nr:hypothetical protein Aeh1p082 [Aeromonas phage Aeh1]AAQ17737.1 hypothetical protein Aeh1ORF077c [Aeromonas phage Aeh1]
MTDEEELKKVLAGFDIKFFQKLCCTLWQLLLGSMAFAAGQAWITDTFVESDGPFAMYFGAGIVVLIVVDIILRQKIKRDKNEITG